MVCPHCLNGLFHTVVTVSYTHLDVYKRQVYNCATFVIIIYLFNLRVMRPSDVEKNYSTKLQYQSYKILLHEKYNLHYNTSTPQGFRITDLHIEY